MEQNQEFYDQLRAGNFAEVQRHGITHVLLPRDQSIAANGMETVYENSLYRIYRVPAPASAP